MILTLTTDAGQPLAQWPHIERALHDPSPLALQLFLSTIREAVRKAEREVAPVERTGARILQMPVADAALSNDYDDSIERANARADADPFTRRETFDEGYDVQRRTEG